MAKLTLLKLMEVKKKLDEAERKRPKTYINGEEYIIFNPEKVECVKWQR